jgi:hypothetical protein
VPHDQEPHAFENLDNQDEEGTDVEAHSLDSYDSLEAPAAARDDEPPDVEGHSFDSLDAMEQLD